VLLGVIGGFAMIGLFAISLRALLPPRSAALIVGYFLVVTVAAVAFGRWLKSRPDWPTGDLTRGKEVIAVVLMGPMTGLAIVGAQATFLRTLPTPFYTVVAIVFGVVSVLAGLIAGRSRDRFSSGSQSSGGDVSR
jgi:hypothetical protein